MNTFCYLCKVLNSERTIMKHYYKYLLLLVVLVFSVHVVAQTTVWRDLHKVKKKETIFGIAKEYGVSIQELINANPEMKEEGYELKKGNWIFVPYAKGGDKKYTAETESNTISNTAKKPITANTPVTNTVRIGVMLPLHREDGDGLRMVEYYRGILLALEQMKQEGINTDVHAWNVPKDADIRTTLVDKNASTLDIIFGPLYSNQVKPLGDFCQRYGIKMVIPFSIEAKEVATNPNIFQVYQDYNRLAKKATACFFERFQKTHHPIFINCNDESSQVGSFTSGLRKQLELANIRYNVTSINTPQINFVKQFSPSQPNVIVINSEKSPYLNKVFTKLDSLKRTNPGIAISIYGYNEWFMYQDYNLSNYFKYGVYIPSTYYYNKVAKKTEALEKLYIKKYGEPMKNTYIPRFAIVGYDQAQFFVRGIKNKGKNFKGTSAEVGYAPLQTRYNFERIGEGGYINNHFQLVHFKADQTMENLVY